MLLRARMAVAALPLVGASEVRAGRWVSWEEARSQASPKPVEMTTHLVRDGKPAAAIAVPDDAAYVKAVMEEEFVKIGICPRLEVKDL